MRYDIEVSGFPSSHAGHLCLLRLTEDDYPNTKVLEDWPSWTLPVLKWGKEQGGVVGYSHSGWGLQLPDIMPDGSREMLKGYGTASDGWKGKAADKLPDYAMPRFDGIGANEYVVTVAHDVCHFISAVDTPSIWELNIWYHTLNAGFRARISGETDFPCIYGDKVGLGRIYVKLDKDQPLDFDNWIYGVRDGRSYCGDGLSHVLDFRVEDPSVLPSMNLGKAKTPGNTVFVGEKGPDSELSQLTLAKPGNVKVFFDINAMLAEKPNEQTESIRKPPPRREAVLAHRTLSSRPDSRSPGRDHRQRPSRRHEEHHRRRQDSTAELRHPDQAIQLDRRAHPAERPHEPDLGRSRRPTGPSQQEEHRLVPTSRRSLLERQEKPNPRTRTSRRQSRLRRSRKNLRSSIEGSDG